MADLRKVLRGERNFLMQQWILARDDEKVQILVKIMDIEAQLEAASPRLRTHNQLSYSR